MIEARLYQASQALPEPTTSFSEIEEKAYRGEKNQSYRTRRRRIIAAVLACTILLLGGVVIAATTDASYCAWVGYSSSFRAVEKTAGKLGVALPENLDDSPFYQFQKMYVVPEDTTYLWALIKPTYRYYSVEYCVHDYVREYTSDSMGYSAHDVFYDKYSISFGSTDNKLYKYIFSLDESGERILDDEGSGSYRSEEYHGVTMQIGTEAYAIPDSDEIFWFEHRVIWIDTDNHVVFSIFKNARVEEDGADQFPDEMIEFAKEIIDMNRTEP